MLDIFGIKPHPAMQLIEVLFGEHIRHYDFFFYVKYNTTSRFSAIMH